MCKFLLRCGLAPLRCQAIVDDPDPDPGDKPAVRNKGKRQRRQPMRKDEEDEEVGEEDEDDEAGKDDEEDEAEATEGSQERPRRVEEDEDDKKSQDRVRRVLPAAL
jgi:hypothetical protein